MKPRTTTNSSCTRHPHFKCMSLPQVHRLRQRQHRHARAYMCRPPITSNYGRASYALLKYRHIPIEVCVDLPTNSCAPGKRERAKTQDKRSGTFTNQSTLRKDSSYGFTRLDLLSEETHARRGRRSEEATAQRSTIQIGGLFLYFLDRGGEGGGEG